LYGENLPADAWCKAENALNEADLLIIGGTSLTVYPAKNLIQYYYGENLVIINRDFTDCDKWANLLFRESLGDVFSKIRV
jgi:NAD-dependent deacetylase